VNQVNSKHIPILDGIRAYAVLMVCMLHFFQVDESRLYEANHFLGMFMFKFSQIGLRGVELFFILSGFLITGILLESKKSPYYFTTFYARRFLRIFPLYYFVLAVSFFVLPHILIIDTAGQDVIQKQSWLWTYTSNLSGFFGQGNWDASLNFPSFGHFLSLSVEEHFYIFWPLLFYFASEKWLPRIMWTIVAISAFSTLFVFFEGDSIPILRWSTIRCSGVLSLGGLIAWYMRNPPEFEKINRISCKVILPLAILFLLANILPRQSKFHDLVTFFTSVLFFGTILVVTLNGDKITNSFFNHKPLFFIGKISYGIYVYHGMLRPYFKVYVYENLHLVIRNTIIASTIYTIICTAISVLLAWISWTLIESPILGFKTRFKY